MSVMSYPDFHTLAPCQNSHWQVLYHTLSPLLPQNSLWLLAQKQSFEAITHAIKTDTLSDDDKEKRLTDWLIEIFNHAFAHTNTSLVRGGDEPLYIASKNGGNAQILFAHGYFSSALHEISHWCIAGAKRRTLDDFGYWYCPDGRDLPTQNAFEQVEIRPQAIECLFTLATARPFFVSADNLNANFDTKGSTFAQDVYQTALSYLKNPTDLPKDAQKLLVLLLHLCQDSQNLS